MSGIFNLGLAKHTSTQRGEEGKQFIIMKDNNGAEYKILNLDFEEYAPREGIVEIEPLKKATNQSGGLRHLNNVQWKVIRDKQTGFLIGIPLGFNPKTKQIDWMPLNVRGMETFDLSIPDQRAKWICVKYSHFYTDSPNFTASSKTKYKGIDKEKDAIEFEISRRTKRKAVDIAESLVGEELEDVAFMLGFDPKVMSPKTLWKEVVSFAENPDKFKGKTGAERFLEVYNSDTRQELSTLKRAISMGVVSQTLDSGINYNGLSLGFNESEAVAYLKKNVSVATSINIQVKRLTSGTEQSMASVIQHKEVKDEKDAEIERLKKELEQTLAMASKANDVALNLTAEKNIAETDPEYAELLSKAKTLGIKGAHMVKSKDKLRQKVEEAEKSKGN